MTPGIGYFYQKRQHNFVTFIESETLIVGVLHGEGNHPLNKEDLIFFWYLIAFKITLNLQKSSLQSEPTTIVC